jgi:internalin A
MRVGRISHPWRRFLRFSVRGLIVFVIVVGAGLGWIVRQAHVQRDAVAAIQKAGGSVYYDWEWSNGNVIPEGKPWAPQFLVDFIGVDYFGHISSATIDGETDAVIAEIERLIRLQRLVFIGSSISDSGLAHLKGLNNLSTLYLGDGQVTNAGLEHLNGLTKLRMLCFARNTITEAESAKIREAFPKVTRIVVRVRE